jgi:hypothetical protein
VGDGRVREKLGTMGGGRNVSSTSLVAPVRATAAESEASEGMTRWRVGASPHALQNSRTETWSPVALIRPEVNMTPDSLSAKTGSTLSAMEVLTTVRGDCDVRVSGLGVGVPVNWSPLVMPGRDVVREDSDSDSDATDTALWTRCSMLTFGFGNSTAQRMSSHYLSDILSN